MVERTEEEPQIHLPPKKEMSELWDRLSESTRKTLPEIGEEVREVFKLKFLTNRGEDLGEGTNRTNSTADIFFRNGPNKIFKELMGRCTSEEQGMVYQTIYDKLGKKLEPGLGEDSHRENEIKMATKSEPEQAAYFGRKHRQFVEQVRPFRYAMQLLADEYTDAEKVGQRAMDLSE